MTISHRNLSIIALLSLAFFAASLSLSCSSGSPELRSENVKVLRVEGADGTFSERLSVFVSYEDSDGPADFGYLTVTHDETGLSWTINSDQAEFRQWGKDRWIGSNILAGPAGSAIPTGSYTIVASDLAGNETTAEISVTKQTFPERAPCSFAISGDTWTLERNPDSAGFKRIWILLFNRDGTLVNSWKVPESGTRVTTGSVMTLEAVAQNAVTAQCYAENGAGTAGVLLSSIKMR
ncbi:MAG TPA: hypothetical protein PK542_05635 [Treponemataceae bacterium]|nr:hypothetical protein [Treponemataceae bacterium]HPS43948.1 hypothetical protein [Treponemataceae bacterium]